MMQRPVIGQLPVIFAKSAQNSHFFLFKMTSVDHEVASLQKHIVRLGAKNKEGQYSVKYGVLFKDDKTQQEFEALLGTLRAAKKRGIVKFQGEMLLSPAHDNVDIILLKEPEAAGAGAGAGAGASEAKH